MEKLKVCSEYGKRRINLLQKNSKAELHFAKLLDNDKCYYIREKCCFDLNGEWCYVDFYIPKFNLAIEIDGKEHNTAKPKQRDYLKSKFLYDKRNILTYRISNDECFEMDSIDLQEIYTSIIKKYIGYKCRSKQAIDSEREYFFNICQPKCNFNVRQKIYAYCKNNEVIYEFNNLFGIKYATGIKNKYLINGINNHDDIFYSNIFIYSFEQTDMCNKIEKYNDYLWSNKLK